MTAEFHAESGRRLNELNRSAQILVVDDNPVTSRTVSNVLREAG